MKLSLREPVRIGSATLAGVDGVPVTVEASLGSQSGTLRILGRVDTGVREAFHRVMGAFRACGLSTPRGMPVLNFRPADLRKTGSGFDLPMALALAAANGAFDAGSRIAAFGELSLHGEVLPAAGVVAVTLALRDRGWPMLVTSRQDARLAQRVPGIRVLAVRNLAHAVAVLRDEQEPDAVPVQEQAPFAAAPDLADIRGHQTAKIALVVAAAGRHNLLFVGPPGSGKTALVRRLPGLLPPTSKAEDLEILKIHSTVSPHALTSRRPLRAPHHTSSTASLLGGGAEPRPGEVTLAHHGLLFLDELPEFRRETLEGLRQPLEDNRIVVGRARASVTMPADFLLATAMNPCPCGYLGHRQRPCSCTPNAIARYRGRISGPLLDRLDLQVEVPALDAAVLQGPPDEASGSAMLRARIEIAAARQRERNGGTFNGRLQDEPLERAFGDDRQLHANLHAVLESHGLSGRARSRLMRIARTLADLDERDEVRVVDVLEAARLRGYEVASA